MVSLKERNPILAKNEVGKSKAFTHDLPPDNFTYGAATRNPEYNVAKLTTDWQYSQHSVNKKLAEKDYAKMNKLAPK